MRGNLPEILLISDLLSNCEGARDENLRAALKKMSVGEKEREGFVLIRTNKLCHDLCE